jgi:hypothetical protein
MKKNILISLLVFCFISVNSLAQENTSRIDGPHQFGIHAGSTTGLGLAYRYWPNKLGFQITTVPVFHQGGDYFVSSGATILFKFKEYETYNIFLYHGNHLLFRSNSYYTYDPYPATTYVEYNDNEIIWNSGVGLGFNMHFNSQFSLDIMLGYGLYDINNDIFTSIAGEIGMFYTF